MDREKDGREESVFSMTLTRPQLIDLLEILRDAGFEIEDGDAISGRVIVNYFTPEATDGP